MREFIHRIAFILLIIGTIGLLVTEFVTGWGRGATITFACLNALGLAALITILRTKGKR